MRIITLAALALAVIVGWLGAVAPAGAVVVAGPNGDGRISEYSQFDFEVGGDFAGGWLVARGEAPQPVQRDDTAGKWIKRLYGPELDNRPSAAIDNGIHRPVIANPGDRFVLVELLQVAGAETWTDWHEEIRTPGWAWVEDEIPIPEIESVGAEVDPLLAPTFAVSDDPFDNFDDLIGNIAPGLTIQMSDKQTEFFFDTIKSGKPVNVRIVHIEWCDWIEEHAFD